MTYSTFIAGLPKAELHVHHVGSASPDVVAELAARHPSAKVPTDPERLRAYFQFTDFAHFIDVYLSVVDLIRDAEDVRTVTYGVAESMAALNIRYAELTVSPYSHISRGIPGEAVMEAIEDARRRGRTGSRPGPALVFRHPRRVRAPCRRRHAGCRDPTGTGWARRLRARRTGDRRTTCTVRTTLRRGQRRPGCTACRTRARRPDRRPSGTRSSSWAPSASAMGSRLRRIRRCCASCADAGIPLEVCPTSNVATRAVPSIAEHPLPTLVAAGVPVSINSDDPPMFSTDLNHEYAVAAELLQLDETGIADLARAAVRQSFAPPEVATRVLDEIDQYVTGYRSDRPAPQ